MFPILLFILLVLHLIAQGVSASCAAFSVQNTTTNLCDCLPGLYNTPSGSPFCGDCDLSCQTCNGPTPTNCTSCFSTDTMTNGQCISPPNQFNYPLEFQSTNSNMDNTLFTQNNWTVSNSPLVLGYFSDCASHYIVGGYNAFGNDAYMIKNCYLLPHYVVIIKFNFYQIDSWNNQQMQVYIDNVEVYSKTYGGEITSLCALTFWDEMDVIYIVKPHYTSNLVFELNSTLSISPLFESWGMDNFQLSVFLCDSTCFTCTTLGNNKCASCYPNASLTSENVCLCNNGYFMNISATICKSFPCSQCNVCLPGCQMCMDGNSCTICLSGYYLNLSNVTCTDPPCYLCNKCMDICDSCLNGTSCIQCKSNYVLNADNETCLLNCPQNTVLFNKTCYSECPNILYWNGSSCISNCTLYSLFENKTCVSSCPPNDIIISNICYQSCPGTEVLLNNSCIDQCPPNFNEINKTCQCPSNGFYLQSAIECSSCIQNCEICLDGTTCSICQSSFSYLEVLYGTSSCVSKCPTSMISYNSICFLTCPNSMFWNGNTCVIQCPILTFFDNLTCISNCPSPYLLDSQICYSICPDPQISFNNTCLTQCPDYYQLFNKTCQCNSTTYLFPPTNECVPACPTLFYGITVGAGSQICEACSTSCQNCSGPGENQCLSCPMTEYFISEFSSCYNNCPNYFFANNQTMTCGSCQINCQMCENENTCLVCKANYRITTNGCIIVKNVQATITAVNNPFSFKITISENWSFFFNNYENFIKSINILNLTVNSYNISTESNISDMSISLLITYYQSFKQNEENLTIWFNGEDSSSNSVVIYTINQIMTIPLNAVKVICSDDSYYSLTQNKCLVKNQLAISMSYTLDPLIYDLTFSYQFINVNQIIQLYSNFTISSLNYLDYNYTFTPKSSSNFDYLIQITTSKAIVNGPFLIYFLNISDNFLLNNHIFMPSKKTNIIMKEFYPISESDQIMAQSINSQSSTSQTVAQGSGYASTLLSSGSGLFVQGLMLTEMIFLLKFVDLHYPPIVIQMFESKNNNPSFIFNYFFVTDPKDSEVLPPLFQYYKVSVYFLNNAGEAISQMFAIILIAVFFLLITPYHVPEGTKLGLFLKILIFIREALVWDIALMYILMNLQKLVFFAICSYMFPPTGSLNAIINLSVASLVGFVLLLWLIHLFEKIKICQSLKTPKIIEKIDLNKLNEKCDLSNRENNNNNSSHDFGNNKVFPASGRDSPMATALATPISPKEFFLLPKKTVSYKKEHMHILIDEVISRNEEENSRIHNQSLDMTNDNIKSSINPKKKENKCNKFNQEKETTKTSFFSFFLRFLFKPTNSQIYLKRYEMLHLEYKSQSKINRYYAFFYYLRQCFLSILAVVLFVHPLIQIFLINLFNLIFVFYTIFSFSFTNHYSLVVCVMNELITECAFFGGLMIGIYDYMGKGDIQSRMNFGWMIILANLVLLYWVVGTGIMRPIMFGIYEWWNKRREFRRVHIDIEK